MPVSNSTPTLESEVTNSVPQEKNSTPQEVVSSTLIPESMPTDASSSFDILDNSQSTSSSESLDKDIILDSSMTQDADSATSSSTSPIEVTFMRPYENWTSVPLDDYTITEGLLLCVVASLLILAVLKLFKL